MILSISGFSVTPMSFSPPLSCPASGYIGYIVDFAIPRNCSTTSEISTLSLLLSTYSHLASPLTYSRILTATFLCPQEASNP